MKTLGDHALKNAHRLAREYPGDMVREQAQEADIIDILLSAVLLRIESIDPLIDLIGILRFH
ncbi:hypothetical protein [Sphingopyxis flava]|uniref:Uncharacterized protein n=1 Tax=Sphingopyxis flava TaxID=1507287 RepID=A0A1T5BE33_9SPHN|nr:hypothetical protein [Sphingopyxis flava]SKB45542.1 hypothetical protein SAMN06295937_1006131 [Sphingopyxis flava]